MQTVSQSWKSNQEQTLVSESFVEVSLDIADPDAIADASSEDNGAVYISNTPQVVSEVGRNIVPYSTLEKNLWILDGSRKILPQSDYGDCGYIGDVLSDDNGSFSSKTPIITINFSEVHSNLIPGITIVWGSAYDEYATDFIVSAYGGENVIAEREVHGNNSVTSIVEVDIVNYDKITIKVLRWCLPYHRPRIEKIFVGINKVYSKSNLFGYTHTQIVDPLSTSLPKAEVSFSIDNVDGSYNPYNTDGLSKYLMEQQTIKTRYGYKIDNTKTEWINGGQFYLSEWSAPQNGIVADFKARDLFEFLFDDYVDNITEITSRNLYDIAEVILLSANLPLNNDGGRKWHIDESLREIYTSAILPIDTRANCLLMIANAGRCVMCQDREGNIRIEPLKNEVSDYSITSFNSQRKPEMVLSKVIKDISVKVYQYSIEGNEIKSETTDMIFSIGNSGERIKVDNPLITSEEVASAVAEWVSNYLTNRITLEMDWRADVRLDATDIVRIENGYNDVNAVITEVSFSYKGGFKATGKGRVI